MNTNEEWRFIPVFEGKYMASSAGRVKSVDRTLTVTRANGTVYQKEKKGQIMCQSPDKRGYMMTTLPMPGNVKRRQFIHILVAKAFFVGPFRPKPICRHLDGDRLNNSAGNIYIGTQQENIDDKAIHGTELYGEDRWSAKLKKSDIGEIFFMKGSGRYTQREIAKHFGVSPATICYILKGSRWGKAINDQADCR